jgi:hypothetical protein
MLARSLRALPGVAILLALVCSSAVAQGPVRSATLTPTVTISNQGIVASVASGLDFGVIFPGIAKTIRPTDATAAKLIIRGQKNAEMRVTMALPSVLVAGPYSLPISFGTSPTAGNMGCYRNQDQQSNCIQYDPRTALVQRIRNNPAPQNTFFIWLGGTVTPGAVQPPGVYKGIVTLTATYTGN